MSTGATGAGPTGYIAFNNILIAWGVTTIASSGDAVGFPVAFTVAPAVTFGFSGPTAAFPTLATRTTIGFTVNVNTGPIDFSWHAIGTKA